MNKELERLKELVPNPFQADMQKDYRFKGEFDAFKAGSEAQRIKELKQRDTDFEEIYAEEVNRIRKVERTRILAFFEAWYNTEPLKEIKALITELRDEALDLDGELIETKEEYDKRNI